MKKSHDTKQHLQNNNTFFECKIPECPSNVWFIDKLLGAASPLTFCVGPNQKKDM